MRFAEKQVQLDCQKRWENFNFEVKFIRGSGCSVKTNHIGSNPDLTTIY